LICDLLLLHRPQLLMLRQLILIELDLLPNFNIASLNLLLFPRQCNR
jgi:hypothetical protein